MKAASVLVMVGLAVGLGTLAAEAARGDKTEAPALERYPYDPACPWGRLSNGRGMVVRCLTEAESKGVLAAAAAAPPASAPPATSSSGPPPGASASAPPPGSASAPPADSAAPADPPADEVAAGPVAVEVGPVTPEHGRLPEAQKSLARASSRIAQCFRDGGLRGERGEVQVKFMVRPRGRAEGVSVKKRSNVTPRAARCVASVIDRRWVGHPEAAVVGAVVVVRVSRAP